MPQSGAQYDIIARAIRYMSTILQDAWQPAPIENLVKGSPVETGANPYKIKLDLPSTVGIRGEDLIGMAWMLLEDDF